MCLPAFDWSGVSSYFGGETGQNGGSAQYEYEATLPNIDYGFNGNFSCFDEAGNVTWTTQFSLGFGNYANPGNPIILGYTAYVPLGVNCYNQTVGGTAYNPRSGGGGGLRQWTWPQLPPFTLLSPKRLRKKFSTS